jgi:hypothetical protein
VIFVASLLIVFSSSAADARRLRASAKVSECNVITPCDFSGSQPREGRIATYPRQRHGVAQRGISGQTKMTALSYRSSEVVGSRPAGCPHSFRGCGASLRVFGRIAPGLKLAANWLRLPRTSPSPGMVAALRGHVFVLERHIQGDIWKATTPTRADTQPEFMHARCEVAQSLIRAQRERVN